MRFRRLAPISLILGVAIGVTAGAITTRKLDRSHSEEEPVVTSSAESLSVTSESVVVASEPPAEYDPEEYEIYLAESAKNKNVEASDVDLIDVASDAYAKMVNQHYPKNSYNIALFKENQAGQRSYSSETYTSRCGIDVSEFNGEIDWQQVADAGYEFAFIRLGYRGYGTDGALHLDSRFVENIEGAQAAGLDTGVYFFAQAVTKEEAVDEAAFVLSHLGDRELQLPVVYDPEAINGASARTDSLTGMQITTNAAYFCKAIENGGYDAGYYANLRWEIFMLDMATLSDYTVWYAGYEPLPKTPYAFDFWQYSDKGEVPGISEKTDLNIQMIPL